MDWRPSDSDLIFQLVRPPPGFLPVLCAFRNISMPSHQTLRCRTDQTNAGRRFSPRSCMPVRCSSELAALQFAISRAQRICQRIIGMPVRKVSFVIDRQCHPRSSHSPPTRQLQATASAVFLLFSPFFPVSKRHMHTTLPLKPFKRSLPSP